MEKPNKADKQFWEKSVTFLWKFQFIRGVSAAWAFTFFLAKLVDISELEVLKFLWAMILSWEIISNNLSQLIGKIPLFPTFSATHLNAIFFTLAICLPGVWGTNFGKQSNAIKPILEQIDALFEKIRSRKPSLSVKVKRLNVYSTLTIISAVLLAGTFFTYVYILNQVENGGEYNIIKGAIISGLTYMFIAIPMYRTFRHYPSFKKGVLFLLGFLFAILILYSLRLPFVSEWISATSDEIIMRNK